MSEPNIIGAYDEIAPFYESYSSKRQQYLDAIDGLVIEQLSAGSRLLDIGSGDGRRLAKIKEKIDLSDIVAIEPSAEMAKICAANAGVKVCQELGENLGELDIGCFDVATALWNIFGHITNSTARKQTLRNIHDKLKPGAKLMLDVNNRHNALAYGRVRVLLRIFIDSLNFKEARGDAHYEWKIGDKVFQASGHLFTPAEIEKLFSETGFSVLRRCSVNYSTGEISYSVYRGQLFYILEKAE